MNRLTLFFVVFLTFYTSLAYGLDCWITRNTAGFRDWKALEMVASAYAHTRLTGDEQLHREAVRGLLAEGRLITLDKGETAEVLQVNQLKRDGGQVRALQIKVMRKGVLWIMGADLECR